MKTEKYVKLKKPKHVKSFGQGETPKHMKVVANGAVYILPFGGLFLVSSKCDKENKIAELNDKGQTPLIHKSFVEANKDLFTIIKEK